MALKEHSVLLRLFFCKKHPAEDSIFYLLFKLFVEINRLLLNIM
jgi:hypothetical protein